MEYKSQTYDQLLAKVKAGKDLTPVEDAEWELRRAEFSDYCNEHSDNFYYTSGRKNNMRMRISRLQSVLEMRKMEAEYK